MAAAGGVLRGEAGARYPRSAALAERLVARNREWGHDVAAVLEEWLAGAEVVVTGQQPGLWGGPLLTLVKACAVAAEVRRRRAAGRRAVGFLWLATADDDLEEMGWGRVPVGEELVEVREASWHRGDSVGGAAVLGTACAEALAQLAGALTGANAQEALALARSCYRPGSTLGEATGTFLARLLRGTDVVLVDACEAELARSSAAVVQAVLGRLPAVWEALAEGEAAMVARGWKRVLVVTPGRLPVFRRVGVRRQRLASEKGRCPAAVLAEHARWPERFLPNAWLRPLVQDAALDTTVAILGGAELAYHWQTAPARQVVGLVRPDWRLRPHVTVVTAAERRLAAQLGVGLEEVLHARLPVRLLPGGAVRRELQHLEAMLAARLERLAQRAAAELPVVGGDVAATQVRLKAALQWLATRIDAGALRSAATAAARWQRLRTALRPRGRAQERELSGLAPLLRLGVEWPLELSQVLDVEEPGMSVLFWEEGGAW